MMQPKTKALTNSNKSAKIEVPEGMMLVPAMEYQRMRQAFMELQQVVNPLFGLDKLQTGKQRRREAKDSQLDTR